MSQTPVPASRKIRFPYWLLLVSIALIMAIYLLISQSLSRHLSQAVLHVTQSGNATLTQVFVNTLYPQLEGDLGLSTNPQNLKASLSQEAFQRVDQGVRSFMQGTDILKVKLFNLDGVTLYSSDPVQVGEKKSDYPGFRSATRGLAVSEVSFRNEFSGFDGTVFQRDLVSSYIPINDPKGGVIGVAEIYTDRSLAMELARDLDVQMKSQLIPLLVVILLLLVIILWRFSYQLTQLRVEMLERDDVEL